MATRAFLILTAGLTFAVQAQTPKGTEDVCGRCHISTVVEWGVSRHKAVGTGCATCHGASEGHIIDERNHVKPERLPRGMAIAASCRTCHGEGCPRTTRQDACQNCHHVHALVDMTRKAEDISAGQLEAASKIRHAYDNALKSGEALVERESWREAREQFRLALQLRPNDAHAALRADFCTRRLNPSIPGFRVSGGRFDPVTGLPSEVDVEGLGLRMLVVAGGTFDMGSDAYEPSRPVHTVRVAPFYLGQYEVTQEQWQKVMGSNPSQHQEGFADHLRMPVENVSWKDCQEFIERLNRQIPGGGFRLPTEAEWEFVARAGKNTRPTVEMAWYRDNSAVNGKSSPNWTQQAPGTVGTKAANSLNFFDMQGNVWEWCSTLYRPYVYDASDGREDPRLDGLRVLRGGGYADGEDLLDPAIRQSERPDRRFRWNGLRLARNPR